MSKLALTVVALFLVTGSAEARRPYTPPPMPAGYGDPGPVPDNPTAQIAAGLRRTLNDPYSVRDFSICPPRREEAWAPPAEGIEWEPAKYVVLFALNARNQMGGYVGQRLGIARFRGGQLYGLRVTEMGPTRDCPSVLDEEIRRLMAN